MEKQGSQQKSQMVATKSKNRAAKQEERWLQIREEKGLEKGSIWYHFLRDCVQKGTIRLEYIQTDEQVANTFTKAFCKHMFVNFRDKLGLLLNPFLVERECQKVETRKVFYHLHVSLLDGRHKTTSQINHCLYPKFMLRKSALCDLILISLNGGTFIKLK